MSDWTLNGSPCRLVNFSHGVAGADQAEVELLQGMGSAPTDGSYASLACDGTVMLYGRTRSGRGVSGGSDSTRVNITSPWADLEEVVYQQSMAVAVADSGAPGGYVLTSVLSPEVQLGMDDDGTRRTSLQEIMAIVTYAQGAGVPITLDASFAAMEIPLIAMEGQSCAAALLAVLDYHPEVVCYMAYGASSATLSLKPLSGLPVVSLSSSGGGGNLVTSASFRQVLDYKPAGVRIMYLRVGAFGRIETTTPDVAGSTGTQGKAARVINWVVRLEGDEPGPLQQQRIRTRSIPTDSETTGKTNFWRAHLPWLDTTAMASAVTIAYHTVTVDEPSLESDASGEVEEDWSTDPDDYPRELVDGTIQPWMQVEAAPVTVKAKFGWSGGTLTDDVKAIFGPTGSEIREYSVKVTGTDANTRVYTALAAGTSLPEWPAPGLASAFLTAFSSAVWEGSCTVTGDAQPIFTPGNKLNLSGFDSGWASMAAVIQSVSYDASSHSTTITCGAPRVMGFGDFYELQRVFKKRKYVNFQAAYERRVEGRSTSGGKVTGGQLTPMRSVTSPGGGGGTESLRALQTLVRKVGENWQVGITPGIFQTDASTVPTLEPDGTPLEGAAAYWWDEELAADTEADTRLVYAKVFIDDSDVYALKVDESSGVEIHLLAEAPEPVFSPGDYQWIHIGTAGSDGSGTLTATSHISGSLYGIRRGGPGSPISVYTA